MTRSSMQQPATEATLIHPTALIESGVVIGERTAVWDNVHLRGPATIGHDCIIGEKTYIAYGVTIGDYVKINAGVYICTGITIQDRVMISAGVVFTNDRHPRAFADGCDGLAPSEPGTDTLETVVETGATIGAGAIIGPGLTVGAFSMIGMGAVVTRSIPTHGLVMGNPAHLRGYVCVCGLRLNDMKMDEDGAPRPEPGRCAGCGRRYTITHAAGSPRRVDFDRMPHHPA